jgi:thioredoxin-related protein
LVKQLIDEIRHRGGQLSGDWRTTKPQRSPMNNFRLQKQHVYLVALFATLLLIGATALDQYRRNAKQAKISIGDTFPTLTFQLPAEASPMLEKQILLFARNGCGHCKHLESHFAAIFDSIGKPRVWKQHIALISIDEPPETQSEWATTATYNSDANDLYFNATPQLYFLDEKKQVVRKFIGALPKEKLEKELTAFLK